MGTGQIFALTVAMLVGVTAWADEIDVSGSWQANNDCGSGIIAVSGWTLSEDTTTGIVSATQSRCGTVEFDGGVRQFMSCQTTPSPLSGLVSGTSFAVPSTGYYFQELGGFAPFASTTFPACTALVGAEAEQRYAGTLQEVGGVATRVDGFFGVDTYQLFNEGGGVCESGTCGPECCTLVLLRNDVAVGMAQTVAPFENASVTFGNVTSSGTAAITPLTEPAGVVPAEFQVSDLALYYDVTTDVAFSGTIEVCLPYPDADDDGFVDGTTPPIAECGLLLLHEEGGEFVNRTVVFDPGVCNVDATSNVICAETDSLSQFLFGVSTVTCGNGVVDGGEDCDQGTGANGNLTSCCTASCTFRSGGEVCRPSAGECDGTAETCTGASGACPANVVATAGTPCAADGNDCTTDECDGFGTCGTISGAGACDDGDFCTTGDTCNGVVCTGGPPPTCDDSDPCTTDSCSAGACVHPDAPDGTACDDGDVCTAADECEGGACIAGAPACGTEVQIAGTKLVVVDKEEVAGKAKVVFVAKDPAITKGVGTDAATISAALDIRYDAEDGGFTLEAGASDGTAGWLVNKATVAKFVNKNAPGDPTEAKVAVIKPGKVLKLVGKGLGDRKLDILAAGAPSGDVTVVYAVDNDGELFRHCTAFSGCTYKAIAAATGAKLVCKNGAPTACPLPGSPSGAFLD